MSNGMDEAKVADGLSAEECAWLTFWAPPIGGVQDEWTDPPNYPRDPGGGRRVRDGLAYAGLVEIRVEHLTVDNVTGNWESFGLTDFGKRVAAMLKASEPNP